MDYMQAAGFLAAVKCTVRCARRSVVVVVQPACAVRCSFVAVTLLFQTCTISFRETNKRACEHIHPPHVPQITRVYLA